MTETNPILVGGFRIPFDQIEAHHVQPGIHEALEDAQEEIDALSADAAEPTWENTVRRLDDTVERLAERIAPVTHLMSVAETPALREAYNAVLPEISAFWSRLPLNEALWQRVKAYAETGDAKGAHRPEPPTPRQDGAGLPAGGADLPPEAKARLEQVRVELAQLQQSFSENVLDATAAFELLVEDESRLEGVPDAPKRRARARAEERGKKGWLLTLDYPSVEPILKYCRDRALRRQIFVAYSTRCRDGEFDNRQIVARILRLRDESAEILGYDDFPDYTLEDRMAGTGKRAVRFEEDLVERTRPFWERDVSELRDHAATLGDRRHRALGRRVPHRRSPADGATSSTRKSCAPTSPCPGC